jgi:hypothetical protein
MTRQFLKGCSMPGTKTSDNELADRLLELLTHRATLAGMKGIIVDLHEIRHTLYARDPSAGRPSMKAVRATLHQLCRGMRLSTKNWGGSMLICVNKK